MRAHTRPLVGLSIAIMCQWPSALRAQKRWTIFYTHSSGSGSELQYRGPGDRTDRRRGGLGAGEMITVPQGSTVCYVIDKANPLLYTYVAASKTVAVAAPENLDVIVKALAPVVGMAPSSSVSAVPTDRVDSVRAQLSRMQTQQVRDDASHVLDSLRKVTIALQDTLRELGKYAEVLDSIKADVAGLVGLKARSDSLESFVEVMIGADSLKTSFNRHNKNATTAHDSAKKAIGNNVVLAQLAALQAVLAQNGASAYAEFVEAKTKLSDELCTTVRDARTQFVLGIKSRRSDGAKTARPVKDTAAMVVLEPRSDAAFEVAAGFMMGPSLARSSFSLKGGVVVDSPTEDPIVRPGMFAMGRLWSAGWLWASIGATKGKDATPDLFFGLVARPGLSLAITQLTLGAGLGLFQVPIGLTKGTVGSALPSDVDNLDKIIDRRYRAGFALTFNLTGLTVGK